MTACSSSHIPDQIRISCFSSRIEQFKYSTEWEKRLARAGNQYDLITDLNLGGCNIKDKTAKMVADRLVCYTALRSLSLCSNSFSEKGLKDLLQGIRGLTRLTSLNLGDNGLKNKSINILKKHCLDYPGLTSLNLVLTELTNCFKIMPLIDQYPLLKHISFTPGFKNRGMTRLISALRHNTTLTSLDLSSIQVKEKVNSKIISLVKNNKTLNRIKFPNNIINTEDTISRLIHIIQQECHLQEISLTNIKINETLSIRLAKVIETNSTLETLDLYHTSLTTIAGKAFAEALLVNNNLKSLDLSCNKLFDDAAVEIGKALMTNTTLTHLDLNTTRLTHDSVESFIKMLNVNSTLIDLNLGSNNFGENGIAFILQTLEHNQSLTKIYLKNCDFSSESTTLSLLALTQMLGVNTSLESIKIDIFDYNLESTLKILNKMEMHPNLIEEIPFSLPTEGDYMISRDLYMRYRSILEYRDSSDSFFCNVKAILPLQQKILDRNRQNKIMKITSLFELLFAALS